MGSVKCITQNCSIKILSISERDRSYQNDRDFSSSRELFEDLANATGGAVFPFDADAPKLMASILEAIAYYAARGMARLPELKTEGAIALQKAVEGD